MAGNKKSLERGILPREGDFATKQKAMLADRAPNYYRFCHGPSLNSSPDAREEDEGRIGRKKRELWAHKSCFIYSRSARLERERSERSHFRPP